MTIRLTTVLTLLCSTHLTAQHPMQNYHPKASINGIARPGGTGAPRSNTFKVVAGKSYTGQAELLRFRPDDRGNFHLDLAPGLYCIVEAERPETFTPKPRTATENWDNSCRKKQWRAPLLILRVPDTGAQRIEFTAAMPDERDCLKKS